MHNDFVTKLLETHVQFEIDNLAGDGYKKIIREELTAAFEWSNNMKLQDVITPIQIIALIRKIVVEAPVPVGVPELAGEMSRKVLTSLQNQQTVLEDIFNRKQFDDIIDKAAILIKVRNEIINRIIDSPTYSKLISNILYTGIKEYSYAESIFSKQIPGLSTMLKTGKSTFSMILPLLTMVYSFLEDRLKSYIEKNNEKIVNHSKTFLMAFLDENQILETGDEIWESISKGLLSDYFNAIDDNDMEDFIMIGFDFWLHFRKTHYFEGIYKELVYYFFEKYGNEYLDVLMDDFGVTREMIINEVIELLSPAIKELISDGYIEERIRSRLAPFYHSDELVTFFNGIFDSSKSKACKQDSL